ncbi:MAG: hypothetical protein WC489_00470 [Patescibacteria group bacterium]
MGISRHDKELYPRNVRDWEPKPFNIINSSFQEICAEFCRLYGESPSDLQRRLIAELRSSGNPVVIDLMTNSTVTLATLYRQIYSIYPGAPFFGISCGDWLYEQTEIDKNMGLVYVSGNLRSNETWTKIEDQLGQRKAHLIIERAHGGLSYIPIRPSFLKIAMAKMWNMLDENNGLLLLQTPPFDVLTYRGIEIEPWIQKVRNTGISMDVVSSYEHPFDGQRFGLLGLRKSGRGQQLPGL